ncbi:tetratricopeptide repeat protein [Actinosynnema sp. NPDC059797]
MVVRNSGNKLSASGAATASGGYANSGIHIGDINLTTGQPVRTSYRQQVQRIAPNLLIGREKELAELAQFCTSPETEGMYAWWRAKAWSGKSALMSWFVLNPPPSVRIVSFFVTARLAGQSDRAAFIDNVMEQLLAILGEQLPPYLTESTKEAHLLRMLADAAQLCRDRGDEFVLLVDGLDEDRSGAHSIAALLPMQPPAGSRVIVAGRPDPPIPEDVPKHHPLRDTAIVRSLAQSSEAQAVRTEMERELKNLLRGSCVEQDLLGLLTAAGGGLTASDLAELTAQERWEIEDHLNAVTGRSFSRRDAHYRPGDSPDVYLLGHEELQVSAINMIGSERLAIYRDRIHDWVETYRSKGWPENTPEYILRGYFNVLTASSDTRRMVVNSTDRSRQEALLRLSGGDAVALREIALAQRAVADRNPPDLVSLVLLAMHRDHLQDRNSNIPSKLPALWALLGQLNRAESTANSIANAERRTAALVFISEELYKIDEDDRAKEFLDLAHSFALSVQDDVDQMWALKQVIEGALFLRDFSRAKNIAELIYYPSDEVEVLISIAEALHAVGEESEAVLLLERAKSTAESATYDLEETVGMLVAVATGLHKIKRHDSALEILGTAQVMAQSIVEPDEQGRAALTISAGLAEIGEVDRAEYLADANKESGYTGYMAEAMVRRRRFDRVDVMIDVQTDPTGKLIAVLGAATAANDIGESRLALELFAKAEKISLERNRGKSLRDYYAIYLAESAIALGDPARAELIGRSTSALADRAAILTEVAESAFREGDAGRCLDLLIEAESAARSVVNTSALVGALSTLLRTSHEFNLSEHSIDLAERLYTTAMAADTTSRDYVLKDAVSGLASLDYIDRAESVASAINEPLLKSQSLIIIAQAFLRAGDRDAVVELLRRALQQAKSVSANNMVEILIEIADAFHASGETATAITLLADAKKQAMVTRKLVERVEKLSQVAISINKIGASDDADSLVEYASSVADKVTDHRYKPRVQMAIARAAVATGRVDWAESIASSIDSDVYRMSAIRSIIEYLHEMGDTDRAAAIFEELNGEYPHDDEAEYDPDAWWLEGLATAALSIGHLDKAESIAQSIASPAERNSVYRMLLDHSSTGVQQERFLVELLSIGRWHEPAGVLFSLHSSALDTVLAEMRKFV